MRGTDSTNSTRQLEVWPGCALTIEETGEWLDGGVEPDPNWTFVDANGHGHFFKKRGEFPTVEWISTGCTMGHGDDCTSEGYFKCRLCDERIEPKYRAAERVYIRGPKHYSLTVDRYSGDHRIRSRYEFGQESMNALSEAIASAIATTLDDFCAERTTESLPS